MLRVKNDDRNRQISISFICNIYKNSFTEINSIRPYDETIGKTFRKIAERYTKHFSALLRKEKSFLKKNKKNKDRFEELDKSIYKIETELKELKTLPIQNEFGLFDQEQRPVDLETKNVDAWKENYVFKIRDQEFKVFVNLPYVKRIFLPKVLIAGFPTVVRLEFDNDELESNLIKNQSYFKWYRSETLTESKVKELKRYKNTRKYSSLKKEINWELISEGVSKKMIIINENCENRLIKVECYPRDGKLEGFMVEALSDKLVLEKLDSEKLPMTERHKYTQSYLDSNYIRVMSYNILAACYTDSIQENEYEYCKFEYLNFDYRRPLLLHEISNYNCDIIFLQECDLEFVKIDLSACMPHYFCLFLEKSGLTNEGEAILIRSDKFKLIEKFDINFADEFKKNEIFKDIREKISKEKELLIEEKGNVLQVSVVEFNDMPGNFLILANTHLYFHPSGDFIRLFQSVIAVKYLEQLKKNLYNDKYTKTVSIMFAGDFNASPNSNPIKFILNEKVVLDTIEEDEKETFEKLQNTLLHSIKFLCYIDDKSTNFGCEFEGVLDYVFYEDSIFEMIREVPFPSMEKIREFTAIPNKYVPSDHLALIFEFFLKI